MSARHLLIAALSAVSNASVPAASGWSGGGSAAAPPGPPGLTTQPAIADQAVLEREFQETLTDAVFVGHWQMTDADGLARRARLGEPQPERYSIDSATKLEGGDWLIVARLEFGETDVRLPLRLRVVWAGDTPIITLDRMLIPGVGVYSARVMVYRNFYSGTWFGPDHGGILSGQVFKRETLERLERQEQEETTDAEE
jgi:hypothetical protein